MVPFVPFRSVALLCFVLFCSVLFCSVLFCSVLCAFCFASATVFPLSVFFAALRCFPLPLCCSVLFRFFCSFLILFCSVLRRRRRVLIAAAEREGRRDGRAVQRYERLSAERASASVAGEGNHKIITKVVPKARLLLKP